MFQLERLHFFTPNANLTSLCITINGLALHLERAGKEAPLRYLLAVLGDTASPLLLDRARCCMHPQLGSMHQELFLPLQMALSSHVDISLRLCKDVHMSLSSIS